MNSKNGNPDKLGEILSMLADLSERMNRMERSLERIERAAGRLEETTGEIAAAGQDRAAFPGSRSVQ